MTGKCYILAETHQFMDSIFVIRGLLVYIYAFDNNPPHIHVKGCGCDFTITLNDRIVEGKAKSKQINDINKFIDEHIKELEEFWEKAQNGELITKIK